MKKIPKIQRENKNVIFCERAKDNLASIDPPKILNEQKSIKQPTTIGNIPNSNIVITPIFINE